MVNTNIGQISHREQNYAADDLIKATFSVSFTGSEDQEELRDRAWFGGLAIQQEQRANSVPPQFTKWHGEFQAPMVRCLERGSRVIVEHSGAGTVVDISEKGDYLVRIDNSEDRANVTLKAPKFSETFMYDKGQQLLVHQDDGSWIDGIVEHFPTTQPIGNRHSLKRLLDDTIGEAAEGPLIAMDLNAWNHSPALVSSKVIYEQAVRRHCALLAEENLKVEDAITSNELDVAGQLLYIGVAEDAVEAWESRGAFSKGDKVRTTMGDGALREGVIDYGPDSHGNYKIKFDENGKRSR